VKLTRISQRPKYPYHWEVTKVRFRDLTGDGIPEIIWDLFTVGGTGSSPSLKGVHQWDGREASRIFRFANGRKPPPGYAYVIAVSWRIVDGGNGSLPEVETSESLHKRDDATCSQAHSASAPPLERREDRACCWIAGDRARLGGASRR
jgi:hypothetical protein